MLLWKINMTIKPHILFSRNAVLDTSFFISKGFNFRNEEMLSLSKLGASGAIQILIVDLTLREVESNMREAAKTAHSKLSQSDFGVLRSLPLFRRFNDIYGDDRIFEYLYKNFQKFITTSKTKIISSNDVFPGTVFDRYFRRLPPFTADAKKNRKGEFPDAFALEAVNLWCTTNQERAYLISSDSDWHEFGKMSMELFDDQPRLIALASISELIDMVIRNDDALVDTSRFADTIFDYQKENIEAEVLRDIRRCKFVQRGEDVEDYSLDTGVLNIKIESTEMVSVNRDHAVYIVHLQIDLVLRYQDNSWYRRKSPPANTDTVLKHHVSVPITISLAYTGGVPGNATFEFTLPAIIEIDLAEAERISAADWIASLPVLVCGVKNGELTDTGNGFERFDNLSAAKCVFHDLDVWVGSSRFTSAMGNKLSDELRFETWRASEFYST
jgi:hypothetical protein